MSFTRIRDERSIGLTQKGGILAVLLVLFFAGTAVADNPEGRDLGGPPGSGWARISQVQVAIIAEELDLGIDDTLISKGCRGCPPRGGRRPSGGGRRGGGGVSIPIGTILSIVRNLVTPPRMPPTFEQPLDPGIDYSIPNIPFDDDFESGPTPVPEETAGYSLHEQTPGKRPRSDQLLEQGPGLDKITSTQSTQEKTPTTDQLLDQGPGLPKTDPPPRTQKAINPVPLSVQALKDLAEQNTQKHLEATNNLTPVILAAGGPNLPPVSQEPASAPPTKQTTGSQEPASAPAVKKPRFSWMERNIPGWWGLKHQFNRVWPSVEKPLDTLTDQNEGLKQVKDIGKAIDRLHKDVKDPEAGKRRAKKDIEDKGRVAIGHAKILQHRAKKGFMKKKLQQYEDMGLDIPTNQP